MIYHIHGEDIQLLKDNYNGYSFSLQQDSKENKRITLFNNYFLGCYVSSRKLEDYWSNTATTSILSCFPPFEYLEEYKYTTKDLQKLLSFEELRESSNIPRALFEAGYLTIKSVQNDNVILGPPNDQIKKLMNHNYLKYYYKVDSDSIEFKAMSQKVHNGELHELFKYQNNFISSVPFFQQSEMSRENIWSFDLRLLLRIMNITYTSEQSSILGS